MGKKSLIPRGWNDYSARGEPIPDTPFVAFKTPLREDLLVYKAQSKWFTTESVLTQMPRVKLIINLTKAPDGRYYNYHEFQAAGVRLEQISSEGHGVVPPPKSIKQFFKIVDKFLATHPGGGPGVIGVHCTHGVNRTGFFICKYLIKKLKMAPINALELFETARGHKIKRMNYLTALGCGPTYPPTQDFSSSIQTGSNYNNRAQQEQINTRFAKFARRTRKLNRNTLKQKQRKRLNNRS